MKRIILILANIALLFSCSENEKKKSLPADVKNLELSDTVYVMVDSVSIKKDANNFDYVLVYRNSDSIYEIYRKSVQDYSSEFEYGYDYCDTRKAFTEFNVTNLPTGSSMSILFDKRNKAFYSTPLANLMLLNGSVNFANNKAKGLVLESPNCGDIKDIHLEKIWNLKDKLPN
jgi:hypothetical protein